MKLIIALCLIAVVAAAPPPKINYPQENVQLIKYENDNLGDGNFRHAFEQTDGTAQEQQGQVVNEGKEDESIAMKGYFTWVGTDGVTYRTSYVADVNGYQPVIEQGPGGAIPQEVIESLSSIK